MASMSHGQSGGRGQAVTEYLVTYGWAIMAVLLVLIALYWLGERCTAADGSLACTSFKATKGDVQITLRNSKPSDIAVCDIICDSRKADPNSLLPPVGSTPVPNCEETGQRIISTGEKTVYASDNLNHASFCTNDGSTPLGVGDYYRGKFYIIYNVIGEGGNARVTDGELFASIQP
jgi:hypothetical protein